MYEQAVAGRNWVMAQGYRLLAKPLYFRMDPEFIHESHTALGESLARWSVGRKLTSLLFGYSHLSLQQKIGGQTFISPVGLSAGFDYDARLTNLLPHLGFGFATVGTITNKPYEGNPKPRLGRLPASKSLMVNKGYKSVGVDKIIKKLSGKEFSIPIGISLGRTNTQSIDTPQKAISDIIEAFEKIEKSAVDNSYYELNISCPNLISNLDLEYCFYDSGVLSKLLSQLKGLGLKRPVWIKMPINISDDKAHELLQTIAGFCFIEAVIFGNLQKDRQDPSLVPEEVSLFERGNFSGKPTWKRSNELIALAYRHYRKSFRVVGTGGVFSAADAYYKIKQGACLVQLITGMIYQGPQLISQINQGLVRLLAADGLERIEDAVGLEIND